MTELVAYTQPQRYQKTLIHHGMILKKHGTDKKQGNDTEKFNLDTKLS